MWDSELAIIFLEYKNATVTATAIIEWPRSLRCKMSASTMDDVFELLTAARDLEKGSRIEAATKVRSW